MNFLRRRRSGELNKWNWSDREGKWVRIEIVEGKKKYYYRAEPPKEFIDLNSKITEINEKLMKTTNKKKNLRYFKELMKISHKMQSMRISNNSS